MERGAERIDVISMHGAIKRARTRKCHSPLKKVLRESDSHLALHIPMVETLRRSLSTGGKWIHILTLVFLYKQSYTLPVSPSLCYIVCLTTFLNQSSLLGSLFLAWIFLLHAHCIAFINYVIKECSPTIFGKCWIFPL